VENEEKASLRRWLRKQVEGICRVAIIESNGDDGCNGSLQFCVQHAFSWEHGTLTDLKTLGGSSSTAIWLANAGESVGGAYTTGDASFHATLWRDGLITDLGTLPGDCASIAWAINSQGQIVGQSFNCDTNTPETVLWDKGSIIDLQLRSDAPLNINDYPADLQARIYGGLEPEHYLIRSWGTNLRQLAGTEKHAGCHLSRMTGCTVAACASGNRSKGAGKKGRDVGGQNVNFHKQSRKPGQIPEGAPSLQISHLIART
jgi:hypothetical protein